MKKSKLTFPLEMSKFQSYVYPVFTIALVALVECCKVMRNEFQSYRYIRFIDRKSPFIISEQSDLAITLHCYENNFDSTCKITLSDLTIDSTNANGSPLSNLIRPNLPPSLAATLLNDMINITEQFYYSQFVKEISPSHLTCRLQLLDDVRCCKWHEDYVKVRLVTTYLGRGTQWCDPNDLSLRFSNFVRKSMGLDYSVPSKDIKKMDTGDILIMPGRHSTSHPPVLHRSPPLVDGEISHKRLLYSVTVN